MVAYSSWVNCATPKNQWVPYSSYAAFFDYTEEKLVHQDERFSFVVNLQHWSVRLQICVNKVITSFVNGLYIKQIMPLHIIYI